MMTESTRNDMMMSVKQPLVRKNTDRTGGAGPTTASVHADMKKQAGWKCLKRLLCC